jgi:hypothetical protein
VKLKYESQFQVIFPYRVVGKPNGSLSLITACYIMKVMRSSYAKVVVWSFEGHTFKLTQRNPQRITHFRTPRLNVQLESKTLWHSLRKSQKISSYPYTVLSAPSIIFLPVRNICKYVKTIQSPGSCYLCLQFLKQISRFFSQNACCVLYGSRSKRKLFSCASLTDWLL